MNQKEWIERIQLAELDNPNPPLVSISKAAKYCRVHPDTLRLWEKQGKIKPRRTIGGHRRYALNELLNITWWESKMPFQCQNTIIVQKCMESIRKAQERFADKFNAVRCISSFCFLVKESIQRCRIARLVDYNSPSIDGKDELARYVKSHFGIDPLPESSWFGKPKLHIQEYKWLVPESQLPEEAVQYILSDLNIGIRDADTTSIQN